MRKNSQNPIEFKTSNTQGKDTKKKKNKKKKEKEKANLIKNPKIQKIIYKYITHIGSYRIKIP